MSRKRVKPQASTPAKGKLAGKRKKLPLDPLLESEPSQLLKGYSADQIQELFYVTHELGAELEKVLELEGEVKEILGCKMDNKTMWFYVKWDSNDTSFVPARVLNRFAPSKVIQYYESVLQFQPGPGPDKSKVNLPQRPELKKHEPQPPQPPQQPPQPPPQQTHPLANPPPLFHTTNCAGCSILLQYPEGTKAIKCPVCNSVMAVRT